jgi:hypothetical protein
MTSERIKEIQQQTAYPDSVSVQQALLQVWNECSQLPQQELSDEQIEKWAKEQSKIEPTGAEEFGRIMGAKWYREQIKLKA